MDKLPHDNFISDEQLAKLYKEKEAGAAFADALYALGLTTLSPDDKKEVEALWDLYSVVEEEGGRYIASREFAEKIAQDLFEMTTGEQQSKDQAQMSQPSDFGSYIQSFSQFNWLLAAPVAVVVLAVVVVTNMASQPPQQEQFSMTSDASPQMTMMAVEKSADTARGAAATAPSGNPLLDTFAILEREATVDREALSGAGEEITLLSSDDGELQAVSTSYDPNAF